MSVFAALTVAFLFAMFTARPASALTCTFASAGGATAQDFNTAANWSCSQVPTNGDRVIIPGNTTTNATALTISVSSVSSTGHLHLGTSTLTTSSTLDVSAGGSVTSTSGTISITSTSTIAGTVSSTSGTLTFTGSASTTATGTLSSNSGNMSFGAAFTNAGTFRVGSGTASSTGILTNSGTLSIMTGTLSVSSNYTNTGVFLVNTGTFRLAGGNDQTVTGQGFYALNSQKSAGTATFATTAVTVTSTFTAANAGTLNFVALAFTVTDATTITGTPTVTSTSGTLTFTGAVTSAGSIGSSTGNQLFSSTFGNSGTFDVGTGTATTTGAFANTGTVHVTPGRFEAPSTYTNTGTVVLGGGTIIHTAESTKITNSSGTETASFGLGESVFVTVQDANRNLLGGTVESFFMTVSTTAAAGSDSETVTLTETTASSGIFRNSSGIPVQAQSSVNIGNGAFDLTGSGLVNMSYTDNQDSADVGSDGATLSAAAASVAQSGGGALSSSGGGGGGGIIPVTPTYQTSQPQTQNLPVPIHTLVKLPNDGSATTQHDTAVYYVGSDGKRHAFPNDKVYFTWYMDFGGVQVVNEAQMASMPLGANVTYKPGKKMVKFTTDAKVYAVAKGGILRWVKTEAAAVELYGTTWNMKIDDINDAFYANYTFGNEIVGIADFNPTTVEASVSAPSDSLQM